MKFVIVCAFFGSLCQYSNAAPQTNLSESQLFEHVDRSALIVGGSVAPLGSHPHSVALTIGYFIQDFFCGASLIRRRTVLTAAHCIVAVFDVIANVLVSSLRGRVGSNSWLIGGTSIQFSHNITYPGYNPAEFNNDLGLLIMVSAVELTPFLNTVALSFDNVPGGVPVKVAGWGRISTGGPISPVLMELISSTITTEACNATVLQIAAENNIIAPPINGTTEICIFHSAGHGVCNGDSGSAVIQIDNARQVCIVSWGFTCAIGAPDICTRISGFELWLTQNIV